MRSAARRFSNPYDFVPLEGQPSLLPATSLALTTGYCGEIRFTLTTLTPLVVHQEPGRANKQSVYEFANLGGTPALPATSLKGMLRSVHEVVTNSTLGLLKEREFYRSRMPSSYLPGERAASAARDIPRLTDRNLPARITPSEALFGAVGGKGDASVGFAGRLFLADLALPSGTLKQMEIWRPKGGMPKPNHESFYFDEGRRMILGRKFYYHQDHRQAMEMYAKERARSSEQRQVEAVPAQTKLAGQLRFINLSDQELAELLYAMELEEHLAHKLGYGKPLGLGSLKLSIDALLVEPLIEGIPARLLTYDEEPQLVNRTAEVATMRDDTLRRWQARPQGQKSYNAFSTIARWQTRELYLYPDFGFWQSERNQSTKTTLAEFQRRTALHPGAEARPPEPSTSAAEQQLRPAPTVETPSVPAPLPKPPEPRRPIDLRPIGAVERGSGADPYVLGPDGRRFVLDKQSASDEVLRSIFDQVRLGKKPRVRFLPERIKVDGKHTNIARGVEPLEETP